MRQFLFFCRYVLFLWILRFNAQQNVLQINTAQSGNITNVACKEVRLKAGYHYIAQPGQSMRTYVDPNAMCQVDYVGGFNNTNIPPVNTAAEVGNISAGFAVNETGAAVYQVPVQLPPGTAGLMPSLSIVYNSYAGDGLLGMGWQISGLSSITRGSKSIYYDGQIGGINFNNTDVFVLDGARLFPLIGTNGGNGTLYGTEQESFSVIHSYVSSVTGKLYFLVETKEGIRMEYGNTADSYIEAGNSSEAFTWLLNKVEDRLGNYYTIHYTEINNNNTIEYRPDYIEYTGNVNAGLTPYNKIKFLYNKRSDIIPNYVAGIKILNSVLLTEIQITFNNIIQRRYDLKYQLNLFNNSQLVEITERRINVEFLNSIKFVWDNHGFNGAANAISLANNYPVNHLSIDYNHDSYDDLLEFNTYSGQLTIKLNNKNGTFSNVLSNNISNTNPLYFFNINKSNSRTNEFLDFDADGIEDILLYEGSNVDALGRILSGSKMYIFSSNNLQLKKVIDFTQYPYNIPPNSNSTFIVGDFDGDGSNDIFIYFYDEDKGFFYSYRKNLVTTFIGDLGDSNVKIYTINIDGDGKDEILVTYGNHSHILGVNSSNSIVTLASNLGFPTGWHRIYTGDFNGDGKTDLLTWSGTAFSTSGGNWNIALSTGKVGSFDLFSSFNSANLPLPNGDPLSQPTSSYHSYFVLDFNKDGKSDFIDVATNLNNNNTTFIEIFISTGYSFQKYYSIIGESSYLNMTGDFDGNDKPELIFASVFSTNRYVMDIFKPNVIVSGYIPGHYKFITDVFNSHNLHLSITYRNIDQLKIFNQYTNNSNSVSYPSIILYKGLKVVAKTQLDDNNYPVPNIFERYFYKYSDAILHLQGKGFLGFLSFEKKNDITNISQKMYFNLPDASNFFTPTLQKTEQFLTSPFTLISRTEINQYSLLTGNQLPFGDPSGKRFFSYPSLSTQTDFLTNFKTITQTQMDTYGNPISQTTQYLDQNNQLVEQQTTSNNYIPICGFTPTYPNRLQSSSTTITRTGEAPFTTNTFYTYYPCSSPQKGSLQSVTNNKGVVTTYFYDAYGNIVQSKLSGSTVGNNYQTAQILYDSKGRFPLKTTNTLGHTIEKIYDDWGNVVSEKDPNGLVTTYEYDGFGRIVKATSPTGAVSTTVRNWEINNTFAPAAVYSVRNNLPDNSYTKTYYDIAGRQIREETVSFDGTVVYKDQSYDANGLLSVVTYPYFSNQTGNIPVISYYYDNFLRPSQTIRSGAFTSQLEKWTYSGNTTTYETGDVNFNIEFSRTSTTDPTGKAIHVSENNTTHLYYEYFSNGKPKKIISNNHVVTFQYDNFGRQTQLNDPDAGITSYVYDELDRLISQTDAQNHTYTMTYDPLGRMTTKTGQEGTVTYLYDNKPKGIGQIGSVIGFNGINCDYQYDNFGRLQSHTETIQNKTYTFSYAYDNADRIIQQTFPSGYILQFHYNSNGYTEKINHNTFNIWQCLNRNQFGQVTAYNMFNQYPHTFNYFDGRLQGQYISLANAVSTSITYTTSPTNDNILSAAYVNQYLLNGTYTGIMETYQYDNFYRLNNITTYNAVNRPVWIGWSSPVAQQNISYAPNGNILHKDGTGDYVYDPVKSHAVIKIENPAPDLINKPQQNILYNSFLQPYQITEGNYELQYTYGYDHQRRISELKQNGNLMKKIIYLGNYEEITTGAITYSVHYVSSPDGLVAMIIKYDSANVSYEKTYAVITDAQGSIMALYDTQGKIVYETSYDAWGRERSATDGSYTNVTVRPVWLIRGYTGHEHLPEFGLINMNGRMYDPLVARMLSPDNFVQDATSTQGYNRYTYVLNNPLKYKDPSGEIFVVDDLILGLIGGTTNLITNIGNVHNFWQGLGYFGIGFAGGSLSTYITPIGSAALVGAGNAALGSYINTGKIDLGAMVQGAVISGIVGGVTMGVGQTISPVADKALSGIASPVLRGAITQGVVGAGVGGIGGGLGAVMSGGDFWNGVGQGALWGGGIGLATGAYTGYAAAKSQGINPWTGKPITQPSSSPIIYKGTMAKGQIRANVPGDYDMALQEWNNIIQQYGNPEVEIGVNAQGYEYRGFKTTLSNGVIVRGDFYYGGVTNPTGWNIKINTFSPPTIDINKIPPIYIRYNPNWR